MNQCLVLLIGVVASSNDSTNEKVTWLMIGLTSGVSLAFFLAMTVPIARRFFANWRASKRAVIVPFDLKKEPDLLISDVPVGSVALAYASDFSIDQKGRAWLRGDARVSKATALTEWTIEILRSDRGYFVRVPEGYRTEPSKLSWSFRVNIPVLGVDTFPVGRPLGRRD